MLFESYKKIDMNPVNLIVWIDTDPRRCFMNHAAKAFTKCLPIEDEIEFHIQDIDYKFRQWMNETDDVMVVKIDGNEFELQFEQDARKFAQIVADLVEQRDETLAICEEVHKIHIQ